MGPFVFYNASVNRVINNETAMGSLPRMTSIEIAEVMRKQQFHVMKAIET